MSTYGGELPVSTRMPPPDHSSSLPDFHVTATVPMAVLLYPMEAITTAVVLLALGGLFGHAHDLASVAPREKDCVHEAKEYTQLPHLVPGNVTADSSTLEHDETLRTSNTWPRIVRALAFGVICHLTPSPAPRIAGTHKPDLLLDRSFP
jgi:hypothetical protein